MKKRAILAALSLTILAGSSGEMFAGKFRIPVFRPPPPPPPVFRPMIVPHIPPGGTHLPNPGMNGLQPRFQNDHMMLLLIEQQQRAERERQAREQLRQQIALKIEQDPLGALSDFHAKGGNLPGKEELAGKIVVAVVVELEKSPDPWQALKKVRNLQKPPIVVHNRFDVAGGLDPFAGIGGLPVAAATAPGRLPRDAANKLLDLEGRLNTQCLKLSLAQLIAHGKEGRWLEAGNLARKHQVILGPHGALTEIAGLSDKTVALDNVGAVIQKDPSRSRAFARTATTKLPADLEQPIRGLQAIDQLHTSQDMVQADTVVPAITDLAKGSGNKQLANRLVRELAAKAFIDGNTSDALALLRLENAESTKDEQAHYAAVLSDMKALILGEGEVQTRPGRNTLAKNAPPAGIAALIPENAGSYGPRPSAAVFGDLPPLGDALESVVPDLVEKVRTGYEHSQQANDKAKKVLLAKVEKQHRSLANVGPVLVPVPPPANQANDEEEKLTQVASELGRPLTRLESIDARQMLRQNRTVAEIVHALKNDQVIP